MKKNSYDQSKARTRHKGKYANAANVLPKYVLALIQEHFQSGLLWIPAAEPAEKREEQVIKLHDEGLTSLEISRKVRLSQRRVTQILQRYQEVLALIDGKYDLEEDVHDE